MSECVNAEKEIVHPVEWPESDYYTKEEIDEKLNAIGFLINSLTGSRTGSLDALINDTEAAIGVRRDSFIAVGAGSPVTSAGFVDTYYHGGGTVAQWTYHVNGDRYFRSRQSNGTVSGWISK